ncbi:MAG: ABC transporter substrate-binding protein [Candidatus Nanopelagicales bacterium]|nr:ABC transporter substrate-binding protein [Candidatus Nanopelagicales bacterium]
MRSHQQHRRSIALATVATTSLLVGLMANGAIAAPKPPPKASPALNNSSCPATPGVTPTTINLGWIGPKTGPAAANYTGSAEAAKLRIDQENAKGGVNGRKLVLNIYDDKASASDQISAVQKALSQDNVFALTAQTSQTAMYATLKDQGIPVTGFSNPAFGTDRNAFGTTGATVSSNPAIASTGTLEKLKQMGVTKIANINHISTGASASGNATAGLIPLVGGLSQVLRIADEPQGTHDATSTALRIKSSGADGAVIVGFIDGAISIMQALKQQGVSLKGVSIVGLSDPASLKAANGALDGALGTNYGTVPIGVPRPSVRTFTNAMKAAGLNPYNSAAPQGYAGADLLITGVKKAGKCPTRASFINGLRNTPAWDANGLIPEKINFKAPGIMPNGNPAVCGWFMIAKGTELVADPKPTCGAKYIDTKTGQVILS